MEFQFNASALAAGAVIERGAVITTTPSLGSVVLTPSGGEGRSVVSNYFSEELEIAHAETRVSGRGFTRIAGGREEQRFASWTSVLMKHVTIFGRVAIGEMGTTIASTRGFEDDDDQDFEMRIFFRDVFVDGKPLKIEIDESLRAMKRYDELLKHVSNGKNAELLAKRFDGAAEELMRSARKRKPVRVSLVKGIRGDDVDALATIPVKNLGVFRFGELILKPGLRRVNLIRATFDSRRPVLDDFDGEARLLADQSSTDSTKGSMILGSGEGNGTPIEP